MARQTVKLGFRHFSLPDSLSESIWKLAKSKWDLSQNANDIKTIAKAVLRMSDFYAEKPADETPWAEEWCQQAQLFYFLPLNFIRNCAVVAEGLRLNFFTGIQSACDFGAGLGAAHFALKAQVPELRLNEIEISSVAKELRRELDPTATFSEQIQGDLFVASYSLTENQMERLTPKITRFKNILILEPSIREDSRRLLKLRENLQSEGFSLWAPCTHQEACPLLHQSATDWCHDRIHFEAPEWFSALESQLPIRNENLTFSYLLASQRPPPKMENLARMTGDTLREKGKTRQLFCRSERREFLSMLSRDGELPEISRGAVIEVPQNGASIGTEYRIKSGDVKISSV